LTTLSTISVVITTLNDRTTVRDCLDRVLGGDAAVAEVLVVDRGSIDGTLDIVRRSGAPVRLIERPSSCPSEALAVGVAEARGEIVAVVPSRAIVGKGALVLGARAAEVSEGGSATVDLDPVGTTAFGRAAAAVVGHDVPGMEVRSRSSGSQRGTSEPKTVRGSSYLVADAPFRLATDAFCARAGWKAPAKGAMVGAAVGMALFGRGWLRAAVPLGHAAVTAARALRAGRDPGVAPHRAFLAAEVWDWSTGTGWWVAGARRLRVAQ
jgi:hypothetical protein